MEMPALSSLRRYFGLSGDDVCRSKANLSTGSPAVPPSQWPKYWVVVGTLVLLVVPAAVLARRGDPPKSRTVTSLPVDSIALVQLGLVDATVRLVEDAQVDKPGPLRFAVPVEVDITPQTAGTWEQLPDGARLWRLRFYSPGATDLNFGFGHYGLPEGATLHVYSESEDYYEGPYTYLDNKPHSQLWLPVVPGDRAVVELYLPFEYKEEPGLRLTHVGTGYRDLLGRLGAPNLKQGTCNIDVICPDGDPWRDEIKSVARYSIGGASLCTGSLIKDVPSSFRHFFLSANHCGVNAGNDSTLVFYWNFESPNCGDLSGGSLGENQTGATFRASKADVDMLLVELDENPESFGVYYSGWDRSGLAPAGSVGIHHPSGDEKAISFNTTALTTVNSCIGSGGTNTHWQVDDWDEGTTEPGSSGSGLWDPATKKIVGHLSGGTASCGNPLGYDCYGKFSVAWGSGGTAASRLKDWLDPLDQGDLMVEGMYPSPTISYVSHQGIDSCATAPLNENGIWEPGETIQVPVEIQGSGDFTNVQGTLTSLTPGVAIIDGTASWPDLVAGVDTFGHPPHFTVALDGGIACFSQADFQLEIIANEGGPFYLNFSNLVGASLISDTPLALVDLATTTSLLEVTKDVTLTDVNVLVDIDHTWVGDLKLTLRSPLGTEVVLLDRPGVPALSFGCDNSNMGITFDDASGFDPEHHCPGTDPWYTGAAAPVQPLSAFNGESLAGTWSLIVSDLAGGDTGTLVDWQLITSPPPVDECIVCEPDDGEPNDTLATATPVACPLTATGLTIAPLGDVDFYSFVVTGGTFATFDIDASEIGSTLNPVLGLFDFGGTPISLSDDNPAPGEPFTLDSYLEATLPAGTFFVGVTSFADFDFNGGGDAFTTGTYTLNLGCSPKPGPGRLLGSTANDASLIDVDTSSGAGTFRAPHGTFGNVTEIEMRLDGVLFGSTSSNIITIDPMTGTETLVGTHTFGAVNGMEFVGSTLYGIYVPGPVDPSQLVTINQGTGALTFIGLTGFSSMGGLAYDPISETMYASEAGVAGGSRLFTIDLGTGAATAVGAVGFDDIAALEFGPDGLLYAGVGGGGGDPNAGSLMTIDPTTGAGTLVGPTGFTRLSGLAFAHGSCESGIDLFGQVIDSTVTFSSIADVKLGSGLRLATGSDVTIISATGTEFRDGFVAESSSTMTVQGDLSLTCP